MWLVEFIANFLHLSYYHNMRFVYHWRLAIDRWQFAARDWNRGVSALTMILGIALILVVLSLGMGLLSYFENSTSFSHIKSQKAYLVAQSGVYDALYKISLNKDFEDTAGYIVAVEGGSATVKVAKNNPQTGFSLITSSAIVGNARKVVEVKLAIDGVTGKMTIINWQEKAI